MMKWIMKKELAIIAVISWMSVIFYLSHQPADASSELSGSLVQLIKSLMASFFPNGEMALIHRFVRKLAHVIAYFILSFLMVHALRCIDTLNVRSVCFTFLFTTLYAISDEYHQTFIPGRSGEWQDVLIDSCGTVLGIACYIGLYLIFTPFRR